MYLPLQCHGTQPPLDHVVIGVKSASCRCCACCDHLLQVPAAEFGSAWTRTRGRQALYASNNRCCHSELPATAQLVTNCKDPCTSSPSSRKIESDRCRAVLSKSPCKGPAAAR